MENFQQDNKAFEMSQYYSENKELLFFLHKIFSVNDYLIFCVDFGSFQGSVTDYTDR